MTLNSKNDVDLCLSVSDKENFYAIKINERRKIFGGAAPEGAPSLSIGKAGQVWRQRRYYKPSQKSLFARYRR